VSRVESIESQIEELTPDELSVFREWFADFDAQIWDHELQADVEAGKLDNLGERALSDHASGRSTKL
jgi:hypothetical protein